MKKISTILTVFCALVLLAAPRAPHAQTINLDSLSGTTFCAGDPISVTFTATGTWGHKNAFTLQLSNDSGSFADGFTNLGSLQDTIPGTFNIVSSLPLNIINKSTQITRKESLGEKLAYDTTIEQTQRDSLGHPIEAWDTVYDSQYVDIAIYTYDTSLGTRYRVRVISAYPPMASADNGTDLMIGAYVWPFKIASYNPLAVGIPNKFRLTENSGASYWNFGDDATPSRDTTGAGFAFTTYSTSGPKMVTATDVAAGGCSATDTFYTYAYGCGAMAIPNDAIVISNDTSFLGDTVSRTFWINPGVTVTGMGGGTTPDTLFVEAGATVIDPTGLVYLKPNASAVCDYAYGLIIYDSASVTGDAANLANWTLLDCTDLSFDYTNAPPNSIMHINENESVAIANTALEQIALSPNPTNGIVAVEGVPVSAQVQVMNVLGVAVQQMARTMESDLTIDLSTLAAGTYYVRIASGNGITTKKVVKE